MKNKTMSTFFRSKEHHLDLYPIKLLFCDMALFTSRVQKLELRYEIEKLIMISFKFQYL